MRGLLILLFWVWGIGGALLLMPMPSRSLARQFGVQISVGGVPIELVERYWLYWIGGLLLFGIGAMLVRSGPRGKDDNR